MQLRPVVEHAPSYDEATRHLLQPDRRAVPRVLKRFAREQRALDALAPDAQQLGGGEPEHRRALGVLQHSGERGLGEAGDLPALRVREMIEHRDHLARLLVRLVGAVEDEVLQQGHAVPLRADTRLAARDGQHDLRGEAVTAYGRGAAKVAQVGEAREAQVDHVRFALRLLRVLAQQLHQPRDGALPVALAHGLGALLALRAREKLGEFEQ